MKLIPALLTLSVAANAALLLLLAVGTSAPPAATPDEAAASATSGTRARAPVHAAAGVSAGAVSWASLQRLDLAGQRDRLRAEGFPPAVVRAILAAQLRQSFAARRKAIEAALADLPFWKNFLPDPATAAALRALGREEQAALKNLLGADAEIGMEASLRRQFPGFSAQQIADIAEIRDRFSDEREKLYGPALSRGILTLTSDDRARLAALEKQMHAELAGVLTPQELDEYDLRTSSVANQLRASAPDFDWTEAEFRAVYRLRTAFAEQTGGYVPGASDAEMRARMDAQRKLDSDIAATLGPERYADYQRATDYSYRQTAQLVARLELPPETANQVYAVQQEVRQRLTQLGQDRSLLPAEREAQMNALAAEAQNSVKTLLGPTGFEAYKSNGGTWLQSLARRLPATRGP